MGKHVFTQLTTAALLSTLFLQPAQAQNSSPYWSLAGNSNATTSSKLGTTNAVDLRLFTNNVERLRILSSNGRVGIGTTAPAAPFDLRSTSGLLARFSGGSKMYMALYEGTTQRGYLGSYSGNAQDVDFGTNTGNTSGRVHLTTLAVPRLSIDSIGRVGIGTTTPSNKLQVVGASLFTGALTINDGGLTATNATGNGVVGFGNSASAYGVFGSGYYGVYGQGSEYGLYGAGSTFGVYGVSGSSSGRGIYGACSGAYGYGGYFHGGSSGVFATGGSYALYGSSNAGTGVYGYGNTYGVYGSTHYGWAGYFKGNVYSTGSYQGSDRKLKQNIRELTGAMSVISKLLPMEYEYRQDGNYKYMSLPEGKRYGLIAQDVEQVLPGLVKATQFDTRLAQASDSSGSTPTTQTSEKIDFKAINYTELIPIIIKGMQEQEAENKALKAEVAELRQLVLELKNDRTVTGASLSGLLEQNIPNPAGTTTTIRYHVPTTAASAVLNITNTKGQVVMNVSLSNRGAGQVILDTLALASGTYQYTLYVDGKQTDTKRLIVAR